MAGLDPAIHALPRWVLEAWTRGSSPRVTKESYCPISLVKPAHDEKEEGPAPRAILPVLHPRVLRQQPLGLGEVLGRVDVEERIDRGVGPADHRLAVAGGETLHGAAVLVDERTA